MMAKAKRAPGGGRKRLGPSVARNLTIRIDDELRERLEIEAGSRAKRKRNWNLSQEILMRLNQSLYREPEGRRDTATRAICFLISELIKAGIRPNNDLWHRDPFLFRSFRLAVGNFLSKIEPLGEIIAPARPLTSVLKTPELLAEYLSEMLLENLFMPMATPTQLAEAVKAVERDNLGDEEVASELLREEYGFERARRHLGIEIKRENGK
jgi:hypothetical protein